MLKGEEGRECVGRQNQGEKTYSITGGIFLLGAGYGAGACSLVQGRFATDDGLTLGGTAPGDAGADFGDGVPVVRHLGCLL